MKIDVVLGLLVKRDSLDLGDSRHGGYFFYDYNISIKRCLCLSKFVVETPKFARGKTFYNLWNMLFN
ncbi:hypothetical protein PATA110615_31955 [Paenibacillus taichungensis]